MENVEIGDLVRRFDNFVHFSLEHKDNGEVVQQGPSSKVESYLTEMEKRLKLRPKSHNQRFQDLLKPMKDLKSFVSVKEFMQSLGSTVAGRPQSKPVKQEKSLRLQYQQLRGGYYLQKIQKHLKDKKFKRSANGNTCFATELASNALQNSQYRSWIEGTLGKISMKNDQFFRRAEGKMKGEEQRESFQEKQKERESFKGNERERGKEDQRDCLIEEHQKEYADQFKVVPHIREMCNQEFQNFSKISTLLTGRLRKILKSKGNQDRKSVTILKNRTTIDSDDKPQGQPPKILKTQPRLKENTTRATQKPNKKRVQTAGTQRRQQSDLWRESMNNKLKSIINKGQSEPHDHQL